MQATKYRHSYGVILVRNNPKKNNRLELLLIKRRMTYHFYSFVMGHYHVRENDQFLRYLFDNMTISEKMDIFNMNFDSMWYRAWLYNPEKDHSVYSKVWQKQAHLIPKWLDTCMSFTYKNYRKKKAKFDSVFGKNPDRLRNLLHQSQSVESLWDLPKGRKDDNETDLETALRELYEETLIQHNDIEFFQEEPIHHSYKDQDVVYVNTFYIARMVNDQWKARLNFDSKTQMCETEYIKWVGADEIDFLNMNRKLTKQLKITFEKTKKTVRNAKRIRPVSCN